MILVDSDMLIAHLRGHPTARDWLFRARNDGPMSDQRGHRHRSWWAGRAAQRQAVWRLFSAFRVEAAIELVGRRAGELMRRYRRSHGGIGLGDYLIAATADVNGLALATLNTGHFPMFPDLQPPFALA